MKQCHKVPPQLSSPSLWDFKNTKSRLTSQNILTLPLKLRNTGILAPDIPPPGYYPVVIDLEAMLVAIDGNIVEGSDKFENICGPA